MVVIDPDSQLYLHPSDGPNSITIGHKLTGTENNSIWSRAMINALMSKNKLFFIDGSCLREDIEVDMLRYWDKCNALVLSWLFNSISPKISLGFAYAKNAAVVWKNLKETLDKVDGMRVFYLHQSIAQFTQGAMTVTQYYTELKSYWEELENLDPDDNATSIAKAEKQELYQFLMGLNETYLNVRGQILFFFSPLASVNRAYSMLIQDEAQRSQVNSNHTNSAIEPTAMYSSGPPKKKDSR